MTGKLDWRKPHQKPSRVLSWKEERLDQAADNWIAGQSLCKTKPNVVKDRGAKKGRLS